MFWFNPRLTQTEADWADLSALRIRGYFQWRTMTNKKATGKRGLVSGNRGLG
jgi:hypothetical protein